jgi:hypothetical protein
MGLLAENGKMITVNIHSNWKIQPRGHSVERQSVRLTHRFIFVIASGTSPVNFEFVETNKNVTGMFLCLHEMAEICCNT